MNKRLLILIGAILITLAVTTGTYAYTYTFNSTTFDVVAAGGEITTHEVAPSQPDWDLMLPEIEFDSEVLVPNAGGDRTNMPDQFPDSGEHWDKVITEDGDSSYIATDRKGWNKDLYNLPDHEGEGTIISVRVYMVSRAASNPTQASANVLIKTNGTIYEGEKETLTTGYTSYSHQWINNPKTGLAWTWQEIDELQAGVEMRRALKNVSTLCTFVYVMIDFELPPVVEGEVPEGDLFTIVPHPDYMGDLLVKVYLTNTGPLNLASQYINMKLYIENSIEAGEEPEYQLITFENGVALFNIEGGSAASYTVEVIGGSYRLVSGDPYEWGDGWSNTPEFYLEVSNR